MCSGPVHRISEQSRAVQIHASLDTTGSVRNRHLSPPSVNPRPIGQDDREAFFNQGPERPVLFDGGPLGPSEKVVWKLDGGSHSCSDWRVYTCGFSGTTDLRSRERFDSRSLGAFPSWPVSCPSLGSDRAQKPQVACEVLAGPVLGRLEVLHGW